MGRDNYDESQVQCQACLSTAKARLVFCKYNYIKATIPVL